MDSLKLNPLYGETEQKKQESHGLIVVAQWIGAALLLVQALASIGGVVIPTVVHWVWPSASPNSVYYQAVVYVFSSPFSILPAFFISAKGMHLATRDMLPLRRVGFWEMTGCVLFGFWAVFLGNGLSEGMEALFPYAQQNLDVLMGQQAKTPVELGTELFYICLVPAVVEEIAFRGVTLHALRKYGDGFAVVVSGVLFGLFHGNVIQLPFAACLGIAAGYITVRTGSLWPAMVLHFCNNAMSCLSVYFSGLLEGWFGDFATLALYVFWLLLGAVGALILFLHRHDVRPMDCMGYEGCLSVRQKTLCLFRAGVFDVGLLILLASTVILTLPEIL